MGTMVNTRTVIIGGDGEEDRDHRVKDNNHRRRRGGGHSSREKWWRTVITGGGVADRDHGTVTVSWEKDHEGCGLWFRGEKGETHLDLI